MKKLTRRTLLASAGALLPLGVLSSRLSVAEDMPRVDPEDAQAKALQYAHESPNPEQLCSNCQLYTGEDGADWGPCNIFPGKQVSADGWCSAWVAKTS